MKPSAALALFALAVTANAWAEEPAFPPRRRMDVQAAALLSMPERFTLCAAFHPLRAVEADVCFGGDSAMLALSAHVYYRAIWAWPRAGDRGFVLGLGPGLGARAMRFCPFSVCANGAGPEALVSLEAVQWLGPRFGLTLQADAGVTLFWAPVAPGLLQHGFRFPARLLAGVAF